MVRCNVLEFGKDLKDCAEQDILIDKFATILSASVIKENGERFIELII